MTSWEQMWAPWRLEYITDAAKKPEKPTPASDCFLCAGLASSDNAANLIAQRRPECVIVLNKFPYNNGHLLIAPNRHVASPAELTDAEHLAMQHAIKDMMRHMDAMMKPDGYNVGLNLGRVAGAGLPGHLHWHLLPRWNGDTNFMPTLAQAKVISQSLEAFRELLVKQF